MSAGQHDHGRHDTAGPDTAGPDTAGPDTAGPDTSMFTAEFWDARYAEHTPFGGKATWSGNPNPHLVTHAADLPPGRAIDLGVGDGADARWLAERGWQVTCVDVSGVALEQTRQRAEVAGLGEAITLQRADLLTWAPPEGAFDLVSAQFLHLPWPVLGEVHQRIAAAVAPGGTLLVVGHHPDDPMQAAHSHDWPDCLFTAEQVAAALDPAQWSAVSATAPERPGRDPDGGSTIRMDAVLLATRRATAG